MMPDLPISSDTGTLEALVAISAQRYPTRAAIRARGETWSYADLDAWSNGAARWLAAFGVQAGDRVAVWACKSCRSVACMQAALRLGAAYVPIDPLAPAQRAHAIMSDCDVRVVVSDRPDSDPRAPSKAWLRLNDDGIGDHSWTSVKAATSWPVTFASRRSPSDLAYILYTSGSTGMPKGVCISHRNALAFIEWARTTVCADSDDVFANHAPFAFDLSVFDLYCAFASGSLVAVIAEEHAYSAAALIEFVRSEKPSIWYSVPSAFNLMIEHGRLLDNKISHLRVAVLAGEPLTPKLAGTIRRHLPHVRLFNFYGPTETNVCASHEITASDRDTNKVPIGTSASGDRVWLVKDDGSVATPGEEGELWVDGPTVMLGYWGQQPQIGPYRTGDICRLSTTGTIEYRGRADRMVKLHGFRVELDEVEAVLTRHPEVVEAAVAVDDDDGRARLVGYVVPRRQPPPSLIALKTFCGRLLPRYMLIERVRVLQMLPRTQNGKVDRTALRRQ